MLSKSTMKKTLTFLTLSIAALASTDAHSGGHHHHHRVLKESAEPGEDMLLPCNATEQTEKELNMVTKAFDAYMADSENQRRLEEFGPVTVPVYIHVITSGGRGSLSDTSISDQMDALNLAFAPHFVFQLAATNRVQNSEWFSFGLSLGSTQHRDMKTQLRQGGSGSLNVYTCDSPLTSQGRILGVATFPWEFESMPTQDGTVVYYQTFPGGNLQLNNLGVTLIHEVGHWLGLLHTFQNDPSDRSSTGCDFGDFVDDTPSQASPSLGCPEDQDTCTDPGFDPIRNMMDYSNDFCKDLDNGEGLGITQGQFGRMFLGWNVYREADTAVPEQPPMETIVPGPVDVFVEFQYDRFPSETSWAIKDSKGNVVLGRAAGEGFGYLSGTVQFLEGTYTLVMEDTANDGTCCLYGIGGYRLRVDGEVVASNLGIFTDRLDDTFEIVDPNKNRQEPSTVLSTGPSLAPSVGPSSGPSSEPSVMLSTEPSVQGGSVNKTTETSASSKISDAMAFFLAVASLVGLLA